MYILNLRHTMFNVHKGAIQVLRNAVGGASFPVKKCYEAEGIPVQFNAISVTRVWMGSHFLEKNVT